MKKIKDWWQKWSPTYWEDYVLYFVLFLGIFAFILAMFFIGRAVIMKISCQDQVEAIDQIKQQESPLKKIEQAKKQEQRRQHKLQQLKKALKSLKPKKKTYVDWVDQLHKQDDADSEDLQKTFWAHPPTILCKNKDGGIQISMKVVAEVWVQFCPIEGGRHETHQWSLPSKRLRLTSWAPLVIGKELLKRFTPSYIVFWTNKKERFAFPIRLKNSSNYRISIRHRERDGVQMIYFLGKK